MPARNHCPNCKEPVKPEWSLCPNCGRRNPATRGKIRCRVCGRSAAGRLHTCPQCGAYLEPKPFPVVQLGLSAIVLVSLVVGLMRTWPALSIGPNRLARVISPPTATAVPTATTTPTSTATATPSPAPHVSPTSIPTGTPTPTATATFTPTPSSTPTETPFIPVLATNIPTRTPTPTPRYGKPVLLGPGNGKIFGREEELVLRWEDMGPLKPNEWYAVRLNWQQNGELSFGGTNVKENYWIVPPDMFWGLADEFTGRKYEWFVFIEEIVTDENGKQTGRPVSEVSDRSTFLWQ